MQNLLWVSPLTAETYNNSQLCFKACILVNFDSNLICCLWILKDWIKVNCLQDSHRPSHYDCKPFPWCDLQRILHSGLEWSELFEKICLCIFIRIGKIYFQEGMGKNLVMCQDFKAEIYLWWWNFFLDTFWDRAGRFGGSNHDNPQFGLPDFLPTSWLKQVGANVWHITPHPQTLYQKLVSAITQWSWVVPLCLYRTIVPWSLSFNLLCGEMHWFLQLKNKTSPLHFTDALMFSIHWNCLKATQLE